MITKIRKRDGRLVDYDIGKIENAIAKAMIALGDGEIKVAFSGGIERVEIVPRWWEL